MVFFKAGWSKGIRIYDYRDEYTEKVARLDKKDGAIMVKDLTIILMLMWTKRTEL